MSEPAKTAMAREIAEIPTISEGVLARHEQLAAIAARIEQARPRLVVLCGRGSSGHVGVYLRYLFEARYGVLVSAAAPSVITTYLRLPDMRDTLFIVISQSGQSPDIVMATEAARSLGASDSRIIFRHILPNVVAPIIVYTTLLIPTNILFEAALSFLGVGVQPPTASWGAMIADATDIFDTAWWYMTFPGLALLLTVLAFNLIGDGLQDALNPRTGR